MSKQIDDDGFTIHRRRNTTEGFRTFPAGDQQQKEALQRILLTLLTTLDPKVTQKPHTMVERMTNSERKRRIRDVKNPNTTLTILQRHASRTIKREYY